MPQPCSQGANVYDKPSGKAKAKGTPARRFFTLRRYDEHHPSKSAKAVAASQRSKRASKSKSTDACNTPTDTHDAGTTRDSFAVPCFELQFEREQIFYSTNKIKAKPLGRIGLCAHSVVALVQVSEKDSVMNPTLTLTLIP